MSHGGVFIWLLRLDVLRIDGNSRLDHVHHGGCAIRWTTASDQGSVAVKPCSVAAINPKILRFFQNNVTTPHRSLRRF